MLIGQFMGRLTRVNRVCITHRQTEDMSDTHEHMKTKKTDEKTDRDTAQAFYQFNSIP
jgi:hypothetical protein